MPWSSLRSLTFPLAASLAALAPIGDARAEVTDAQGAKYGALCRARGVPAPPDFGGKADPSCAAAGCVTGRWRESGQLAKADGNATHVPNGEAQSFNSRDASDLFYYVDRSSHTPGLCVANARRKNGYTDFFGVICQGTNGKVCFWDQAGACKNNPGCFPYTDRLVVPFAGGAEKIVGGTRWLGGAGLVGAAPGSNGEGVCSDCHAGENAFVNHPGTATDILSASANQWGGPDRLPARRFWFPTKWPDPIVPSFDSELGRAWPQNPGPGAPSPAESVCFDCHVRGDIGGRFPAISNQLPGYCDRVFASATTRQTPSPACAPTDRSCPSGAMPPAGHAPSPSYPSDPFAKHTRDVACRRP